MCYGRRKVFSVLPASGPPAFDVAFGGIIVLPKDLVLADRSIDRLRWRRGTLVIVVAVLPDERRMCAL